MEISGCLPKAHVGSGGGLFLEPVTKASRVFIICYVPQYLITVFFSCFVLFTEHCDYNSDHDQRSFPCWKFYKSVILTECILFLLIFT